MSNVFSPQTSEYNALKDDLLSASRHGETLLNCIKRPGEPRTARLCPDKLINVTAVERLLVQLEETERTFDEFWTRHEGRLTQCLQLRRFETDFRELQVSAFYPYRQSRNFRGNSTFYSFQRSTLN